MKLISLNVLSEPGTQNQVLRVLMQALNDTAEEPKKVKKTEETKKETIYEAVLDFCKVYVEKNKEKIIANGGIL